MCGIISATLKVTLKCNYNCDFCYQHQDYDDELLLDNIKYIINGLKREGCSTLMISGGEPLLREDIEQIISFASKTGLNTKLATNGILLNKSKLISLKDAGLNEVFISIGDMQEIKTLERFVDIMDEVLYEDLDQLYIGVNVITSRTFIQQANQYFDWLVRSGVRKIFLIPPKPSLNNAWFEKEMLGLEEHLKLYKEVLYWNERVNIVCDCAFNYLSQLLNSRYEKGVENASICPAAKRGINIASNGLVYPCSFFEHDSFCAGKFDESDFSVLMDSDGFKRFREIETKNRFCPQCLVEYKKVQG